MKKTFLAFLLIFTFIYSDETLIEIEDLKPISYENGIDILLVEGQFEEAKILLDDYSKKNSYYYNYTMGKIFYETEKKDEALKYFEEAIKYDNNVKVNLEILKIYIGNKSYKEEVEKKFAFLDTQSLNEKEKNQLDSLKETYNSIYKFRTVKVLELGLTANDNKDFTSSRDSEIFTTQSFGYYANKELKNGSYKLQSMISNKLNFESDGTEGLFVYVGGEYMNNYKGLDYGIPLYLSYDATSDDEISLLTGLNYNRKISLEKLLNTGVTFNFVDNDNYKGLDLGLYGNFMLRKKMNYNLFSKITTSIYDENSFEENKIELALTVDKLLKEKYYVFGKYSIEYIDGSYEVEGEGRRDLINTLKIGYKQNVFRDDITLGVDYTYANDDVNFEGYSSSKNIINTSVKWEF